MKPLIKGVVKTVGEALMEVWHFTSLWIFKGVVIIVWKLPECGVLSGLYFPVLGLNAVLKGVNICILCKKGKMKARKNSIFGHLTYLDNSSF